jgi:autotransporter-associated beta strand protein
MVVMKQVGSGLRAFAPFAIAVLLVGGNTARAASGTWNGTQNAMWSNSANWSASPFPQGDQTATFDNAGNGNTAISLAGLGQIRNITFTGPSAAPYTLGLAGQSVTLIAGGEIRLTETAANSQVIQAGLELPLSNASFTFRNDHPGRTLTFNRVYGYEAAGATKTLTINGAGPVTFLGDLDRINSGLVLNHASSGALTLNGNTRLTWLNLDGTNAMIDLGAGTTMTFANAGNVNLLASQNATINGPGAIALSASGTDNANNAAATGKTLILNAKLTGTAGFEYYGDSTTQAGTFVMNGANDYAGPTLINSPGILQCAAVGNRLAAGPLGAGTNVVLNHADARLLYTGAGETTDRLLAIQRGGILEHAGTGPLVFTAPVSSTSTGAKTLVVRNAAAAPGEFRAPVQNGAGTLSLAKEGDGEWLLSAANTFTGTLAVNGGTLRLTGADGSLATSSCAVSNGATLLLGNTAANNNGDRLIDASAVALLGGTLRLANDGGDADFGETAGTLAAAAGAGTVSIEPAAPGRSSVLRFASLARTGTGATLNFAGNGLGESDRCRVFIEKQGEGLIGDWVTVNGGPAFYDPVNGVCAAPTWTSEEIAARGPGSVIPDNPAAVARITLPGEDGPVTLEGDPTNRTAALVQASDTPAVVATAGRALLAYSAAIETGAAALTLGAAPGDGALAPLAAGGTFVLANASDAPLTVNAALADHDAPSAFAAGGSGPVVIAGPVLHTGPIAVNGASLTFAAHDVTQRVAGPVTGCGTLVKSGTNLLHLAATNAFTGPFHIDEGIVRVGVNNALGTTDGPTVIAAGATLDVGGAPAADSLDMRNEPILVAGAGAPGAGGAIINNSTAQQWYATGRVALGGDATFGTPARWDIRDGTFDMDNHTLTKTGGDVFSLSQTAVTPGGDAAAIDVREGTLRMQRWTSLNGNAANTVHLRSGTEINFYDLTTRPPWTLACGNNTRYYVDNHSDTNQNVWGGPVVLGGTLTVQARAAGGWAGFAGPVSGTGTLCKAGEMHFRLAGTESTYTGLTHTCGGYLYAACLRNTGQPSSLGCAGPIRLGDANNWGRLVYTGSGDTSDRPVELATEHSGNTFFTLTHSGSGRLVLSNVTVTSAFSGKTLYLTGNTDGTGEIASALTDGPSGRLGVTKQGSGAWELSGDNTYSNPTQIDDGTLTFSGSNTLGELKLNKGRVTVTGTNVHAGQVFAGSGNNGTLALTAGTRFSCAANFIIGATDGSGALLIDGGSFSNSQAAGSDNNFVFGRQNGSYGYLRMTGGEVFANRFLMGGNYENISHRGIGVARVSGGALRFTEYMIIGRNPGSEAVWTMDGGALTHTNQQTIALGRNGGRGELNLTGGSVNNAGRTLNVQEQSGSSGTGIVNLCSGRLVTLDIANPYNAAALLSFSGGTLAPSGNTAAFIPANMTGVYSYGAFGAYAGGAVIDSNGKNITIPAAVRAPTGQGVYAVALEEQGSGYIGEPYVAIAGDGFGATAVANLEDDGTGKGTFKVASVTVTCPGVNYSAAPAVLFKGGGFNIVTARVGAVTLAANAGGGLTKAGDGTLTLAGTNTYSGATVVAGGTLALGHARALPADGAVTLAGGTLNLNGHTVTNALGGTGQLTGGTVVTTLSPGGAGVIGTDTLTLAGATLTGTYLADVSPDGGSDLVAIQGDIDLSGLTLRLVDADALDRHRVYTLLTCTGARTGTFADIHLPDNRWRVVYRADGTVELLAVSGTVIRIL